MNIWQWISALVFSSLLASGSWAQSGVLAMDWQRSYAPEGMSLESRAATVTAEGHLVVLGVQRPLSRGKDKSKDKGWIGIYSSVGDIKEDFAFVLQNGDAAVQEVDALIATPTNEFLVAGLTADGESLLISIDPSRSAKTLHSFGRKRIAFILRQAHGELIVGGRDGRDLYVARLSSAGVMLWERSLDRGADELFLAGVLRPEGALLLEHSGVREQFFMRDAAVGLTVVSEGRDSIGAPAFSIPGRACAVVAAGKGYALLTDGGVGVQQSLKFIKLSETFKSQFQTDVLNVPFSLERARLAQASGGGYLVAAQDGVKLVWLRLDEAGAVKGRYESPANRVFLHPDVVSANASFAIATEVSELSGQVGTRKSIYAAKLASPL